LKSKCIEEGRKCGDKVGNCCYGTHCVKGECKECATLTEGHCSKEKPCCFGVCKSLFIL